MVVASRRCLLMVAAATGGTGPLAGVCDVSPKHWRREEREREGCVWPASLPLWSRGFLVKYLHRWMRFVKAPSLSPSLAMIHCTRCEKKKQCPAQHEPGLHVRSSVLDRDPPLLGPPSHEGLGTTSPLSDEMTAYSTQGGGTFETTTPMGSMMVPRARTLTASLRQRGTPDYLKPKKLRFWTPPRTAVCMRNISKAQILR